MNRKVLERKPSHSSVIHLIFFLTCGTICLPVPINSTCLPFVFHCTSSCITLQINNILPSPARSILVDLHGYIFQELCHCLYLVCQNGISIAQWQQFLPCFMRIGCKNPYRLGTFYKCNPNGFFLNYYLKTELKTLIGKNE